MKFTYSWLKDFVEIRLPPEKLAEYLTMAGLEVVSLEKIKDDFIFEIEITSNRPDLLSVLGIAREVSAITGIRLKEPCLRIKDWVLDKRRKSCLGLKIEIEDKLDCPLYSARIIKEIKVGLSPDWLRRRLEAVGIRTVNNIVDITNYVQLTLGQPLHAFDLEKIKGNYICVRRAKDNEGITTLDGKFFSLNREILVIADKEKPIAIAGIMGSKDSEVTLETKDILLESAKFNPVLIRRMRQKLGLVSESQYRFERDVDINNVLFASDYAVKLIEELCRGRLILSRKTQFYPSRKKTVLLDIENVERVLGKRPSKDKIVKILKGLGFKIKRRSRKLKIEVPSFRKDIKEEIDLIEEIARLWGYDKTPLTLPYIMPSLKSDLKPRMLLMIREILLAQGFSEVINYSLLSKAVLKQLKIDIDNLTTIANPLSSQQEVLRPSLLAGLLLNVSKNIRHKEAVLLFEIGKVFSSFKEDNFLGLILAGKRVFLKDTGKTEDNLNLLHIKGVLELIFNKLGVKNFDFVLQSYSYLESGFKILVGEIDLGYLGKVDLEVVNNFDINKKDVFIAELNLDTLIKFVDLSKSYQPLPIYPVVRRDISMVIKDSISLKDVLKSIEQKNFPLLKETNIIDFYKGPPIPSGFRSITLSCLYYSDTHTLTEEEVTNEHLKVCNLLKQEFSVELR